MTVTSILNPTPLATIKQDLQAGKLLITDNDVHLSSMYLPDIDSLETCALEGTSVVIVIGTESGAMLMKVPHGKDNKLPSIDDENAKVETHTIVREIQNEEKEEKEKEEEEEGEEEDISQRLAGFISTLSTHFAFHCSGDKHIYIITANTAQGRVHERHFATIAAKYTPQLGPNIAFWQYQVRPQGGGAVDGTRVGVRMLRDGEGENEEKRRPQVYLVDYMERVWLIRA